MNLTKKFLAGSVLAAISSSSFAQDFYICPPTSSPTCTNVFEAMAVNLESVSLYKDLDSSLGISAGDSVIDYGDGFVTSLTPDQGFGTTAGLNNTWSLTIGYDDLAQSVVAINNPSDPSDTNGEIGESIGVAAAFVSGTIDLFYSDGGSYTSPTLVAQLQVLPGGQATIGNFVGSLEVDFTNVVDTSLAQSMFFFDQNGGESWYDLWLANENAADPDPVLIQARFDTNIDNVEVLAVSDPLPTDPAGGGGFTPSDYNFMRTTELDGSIRFAIPEPGTLALIGAGMLGAGFAARRRNAKP